MLETINLHGDIIEIEIIHHSAYVPAKTYGPPEDCYPAEGMELEWAARTEYSLFNSYLEGDGTLSLEIEDILTTLFELFRSEEIISEEDL